MANAKLTETWELVLCYKSDYANSFSFLDSAAKAADILNDPK